MRYKKIFATITLLAISSGDVFAQEETEKQVQDMSDPLAVYTQVGGGYTNHGINIKLGQAYDTGNPETLGMNIAEFIGGAGDAVGWDDDKTTLDDSFDSFRYRNFNVNLTNGRGSQIDVSIGFDETAFAEKSGTASYSIIQALPKVGSFNLYPLIGAGLNFGENIIEDDGTTDSGYSLNGSFYLVGLYSKYAITEKIWLNYNPFWLSSLGGAENYKDNAFGLNQGDILTHEFALSYQISPIFNVRYFANWNENVNYDDGNHRIEFNYQL